MMAVQPHPEGSKSMRVTLIASPGSAPSMKTGPTTGLTLSKSSLAMSAAVELGVIWPPDASIGWNSTLSPGAMVSAGGCARAHPKWP
jgi:hypothetical protein